MNILSKLPAVLAVAFLFPAAGLRAALPFADRPSDSYSNYKDENGKLVEPLWGSERPEDFGARAVTFDPVGVAELRPVPAAGVHPRIYFGPDDLPEIRQRLKDTRCGRLAFNNVLCWTNAMKGEYDDKAAYAQPDLWKGGFSGLHGPVPLFRLGIKGGGYNRNPQAAAAYRALADGTATEFPSFYWNVFPLEAFRCLVENDEAGAKILARAVVTALKLDQAARAAKGEAGPPAEPVGRYQLAYTYDLLFNFLTPAQKSAMHDELAAGSWSHDNYGTFNTATASRSNWATFSYWLMEVLAVEGEPGFNELKVRGMYRGWRNLLTYGWFRSGATFEGEAKNQLGMDGIIAFARRAKLYNFENLCGHPYLRAYAMKFLPHSVIPTLDGFITYDLLGGAHGRPMVQDSLGLKYMFPRDPIIDWTFRSAIGENYEHVADRPDGYRNDLLFTAIFANDFDPRTPDPSKGNLGNTFFCGERSLMMTRSGWDSKDALMLNMHTRGANGGHPFADRNAIMFAGAGRVWSPPGYASFTTPENSVVGIDGKTQSENSPGRMVDFVDAPLATFATGDAAYAWDWTWRQFDRPHGGIFTVADVREGRVPVPKDCQLEKHNVNDFALDKLSFDYLNVPLAESPSWIQPAGAIRPVLRQANYPVRRALRTAGLVRGQFPYALVIDDIQKDDAAHRYDWTLALEPDIQIAKVENHPDGEIDVFLTGNDPQHQQPAPKEPLPALMSAAPPPDQPMLLVRVLNVHAGKPVVPTIVDAPNARDPKKYSHVRRLVIPAEDSVAPDFKVLLYAYRQGQPLPATTWDARRETATLDMGGQRDTLRFTPGVTGRTGLTLERGGNAIVKTANTFVPLTDP